MFAVPGRTAERHFIEFGGPFRGFRLQATDYRARVEARLGHMDGWQPIVEFTLRAGHITTPDRYLTYSNSPHDLTEEGVAKASAALAAVFTGRGVGKSTGVASDAGEPMEG